MNAVAPGPIWTPLNPFGGQPKEKIPEFGKDTPMGRPGQPNEVAPSFCSSLARMQATWPGRCFIPMGATQARADWEKFPTAGALCGEKPSS